MPPREGSCAGSSPQAPAIDPLPADIGSQTGNIFQYLKRLSGLGEEMQYLWNFISLTGTQTPSRDIMFCASGKASTCTERVLYSLYSVFEVLMLKAGMEVHISVWKP